MKKVASIFALSLLVFSSCNDTNYLYDVKEKYVILDEEDGKEIVYSGLDYNSFYIYVNKDYKESFFKYKNDYLLNNKAKFEGIQLKPFRCYFTSFVWDDNNDLGVIKCINDENIGSVEGGATTSASSNISTSEDRYTRIFENHYYIRDYFSSLEFVHHVSEIPLLLCEYSTQSIVDSNVISKEVLKYRSNKEEVLSLKHSKGTNVSFVFNDAICLEIKEEYSSKVSNMEFKVEDFKNDNIESIRYIDDLFVANNKLVLKLKKDGQHYIKDSLECVKNLDFVENAYRLTPSML